MPTALALVLLAVTPIAIYVLALLVGFYVLLLIAAPLVPGTPAVPDYYGRVVQSGS